MTRRRRAVPRHQLRARRRRGRRAARRRGRARVARRRRLPRDVDAVVVPGGFAHGDYLRTGAIARFSPVMDAVADVRRRGGPVVGICNGFQVLTEAGLLPGRAAEERRPQVPVRRPSRCGSRRNDSVLTLGARPGDVLAIPINHFEGNYTCSTETLAELRADDRVVLPLRRQPERHARRHRRRLQRRPQRRRAHAAPRAGQPRAAGLDRRQRVLLRLAAGRRGPASSRDIERVIPAFLSTAASTPTSRHAA